MPYLIDGHNLIGKLSTLSLHDLDDEFALFTLLEKYFKSIRKKAVVYFDHANVINNKQLKGAFVRAKFINHPSSADEAIILELRKLKGNAKNYKIVTSDNWIINAATRAGAQVIKSETFASQLLTHIDPSLSKQILNKSDTDYWLEIFHDNS